jgi:carbonic anhydrase
MDMSERRTRREFVGALALAAAGAGAARLALAQNPEAPRKAAQPPERPTPDAALKRLLDGNARFVAGRASNPCRTPADFSALAQAQYPFAAIVGCSDSRVGPEILFDQGAGDLFVVRAAGNVVRGAGAAVTGSVEYAVEELGVSLVMVLGHSNCGAVKAAIAHAEKHEALPGTIGALVALVEPVLPAARARGGDLLVNAVRANVEAGVERLRTLDPVVTHAIKDGKIKVVGATYDLRTGRVAVV